MHNVCVCVCLGLKTGPGREKHDRLTTVQIEPQSDLFAMP